MRSDKTRPAGIAMMALGLLAALVLLAGPAAADDDSTGTNASNGSVTSGVAVADEGSTASGASVATDGSVASGCSVAENGSTASGGECEDDDEVIIEVVEHERHGRMHEAEVAKAQGAKKLAVTGSSTLPLAAGAAGLVLVGGLIVAATSDRRRALAQS